MHMKDDIIKIQSLEKENAELKKEVARLQELLSDACIDYSARNLKVHETKRTYSSDTKITNEQINLFISLFRGRTDIYARSYIYKKTGKLNYSPSCDNFWKYGICPKAEGHRIKCLECNNSNWTRLKYKAVQKHFAGASGEELKDIIGLYPFLPDGTCYFLVFDFDSHKDKDISNTSNLKINSCEWKNEVAVLLSVLESEKVDYLLERSRSGNGAHIWIFFDEPVPVPLARKFGAGLLTCGAELMEQKHLSSYDRMIPTQDKLPDGGIGNLIALPLQGNAVKNGNTLFVDKEWNIINDQWGLMQNIKKLGRSYIDTRVAKWSEYGILGPLAKIDNDDLGHGEQKSKPWAKKKRQILKKEDFPNTVNIVLANKVYVEKGNIKSRALNRIRRIAAFSNPEFYKNQNQGYSNHNVPRIIQCFSDTEDYICLPRGCETDLRSLFDESDVEYRVQNEKHKGTPVDVEFIGELYPEQKVAADTILSHDYGIIGAATGFGKTVIGAYLVASLKVNTLVLVHNREIMKNWITDFEKFLEVKEELPEYETKRGKRKRKSIFGKIYSTHNSLNGIIDIAMITSLGKNDNINQIVKDYGLVIVDECHHSSAVTHENVLNELNAKYIYGLTATPKREDGQEKKIFMQFGPIRYRLTAKDRAKMQGFSHYVYPRFTRLVNSTENKWTINEAYKVLINDQKRNEQIISDAKKCIERGRTPLILTKFKEHAAVLTEMLKSEVQNVFLLQGGRSNKDREKITNDLKSVPVTESLAVVAIGKYIGEGFNLPRLDTMMLAVPIAWQGNVEQYAGRLHRDYEGKLEVIIYDYVDIHIKMLERMYHKRINAYKKIGYEICSSITKEKESINSIFDAKTFRDIYENDLSSANNSIIITSPGLNNSQVNKTIRLTEASQYNGVQMTVLTLPAHDYPDDRIKITEKLISKLKSSGIYVKEVRNLHEHFAIIDREVVWYGSINLLSRTKEEDNMIRIHNKELSEELLEYYFGTITSN